MATGRGWLIVSLLCSAFLGTTPAAAQTSPILGASGRSRPSTNWDGYVADNAYYSGISALMQLNGSPTMSADREMVAWVGIGGSGSPNLIQAGITLAGTHHAWAWFEMLPASAQPISLPVNEGDNVRVDLSEVSPNNWRVTVVNGTNVFQQVFPYVSCHCSADWIVEAPTGVRTDALFNLSPIGRGGFWQMNAVANGNKTIAGFLYPRAVQLVSAVDDVTPLAEKAIPPTEPPGTSFASLPY